MTTVGSQVEPRKVYLGFVWAVRFRMSYSIPSGALLILLTAGLSIVVAITTIVFGALALSLILVNDASSCFADIYSASVSIRNVASKPPRWLSSIMIGCLSAFLALVLPVETYEWFLLWIVSVFIPLFGVVITDHFLVKRGYRAEDFYEGESCWYLGGLNFRGIIAWLLGVTFYYVVIIGMPSFGASIPALLFSMASYALLSKI